MSFVIGGTTGAIVGSAGIGALGSIAGGLIQGNAAGNAAEMQAQAAQQANALQSQVWGDQKQMYGDLSKQIQPWQQAGVGALGGMQGADFQRDFTQADFQQDPGYAFRMSEGAKALERSAAARGTLGSGGSLKALTRYGQDYASGEYQNAYNRFNADRDRRFGRLGTIAGYGQNALGMQGNAMSSLASGGQNYANQTGQNLMGAANASGAAQMASANAWSSGINNVAQMPMNIWAIDQINKKKAV